MNTLTMEMPKTGDYRNKHFKTVSGSNFPYHPSQLEDAIRRDTRNRELLTIDGKFVSVIMLIDAESDSVWCYLNSNVTGKTIHTMITRHSSIVTSKQYGCFGDDHKIPNPYIDKFRHISELRIELARLTLEEESMQPVTKDDILEDLLNITIHMKELSWNHLIQQHGSREAVAEVIAQRRIEIDARRQIETQELKKTRKQGEAYNHLYI